MGGGLINNARGGAGPLFTSDKYKYMNNLNVHTVVTPADDQGYAETWPKGVSEMDGRPRPDGLPIDRNGVQIFKPDKFSDDDIAGEGLHIDPIANVYREALRKTLDDEQIAELKHQPDYVDSIGKFGMPEDESFNNVLDAALRGFTVNQWPKDAIDGFFTPQQKDLLTGLKNYMITGDTPANLPSTSTPTSVNNNNGKTPLTPDEAQSYWDQFAETKTPD